MSPAGVIIKRPARLVIPAFAAAILLGSFHAVAAPIMGSDLASFAVLAGRTVTDTGLTTITGNVGVSPGTAITGTGSISITGTTYTGVDAVGVSAQSQLVTTFTTLGNLGPGTTEPVNLSGLTLVPGVYTVPAGVSNLTGTLILDGKGIVNATWVFKMPSTFITSPGSVVDVVNTGTGGGIYWDVGSSATIDTTTSFEGNILAVTNITLNHGATISCGRALAQNGSVTMDTNTIDAGPCVGIQTSEPGSLALLCGALGLLTVVLGRNSRECAALTSRP